MYILQAWKIPVGHLWLQRQNRMRKSVRELIVLSFANSFRTSLYYRQTDTWKCLFLCAHCFPSKKNALQKQ